MVLGSSFFRLCWMNQLVCCKSMLDGHKDFVQGGGIYQAQLRDGTTLTSPLSFSPLSAINGMAKSSSPVEASIAI
jgi:hypothetical protein